MKGVLVLSLMFIGAIQGLPATPSKKDEVELVPSKGSPYGDQPIVDTGALFPGDDEGFFGGFQYFQSLMARIRQQMDDLLKTLPIHHGNSNGTDDFGDFPIGSGLVPRFPSIDLGKGNTTSVTKVIDGHKVVINETEYKKEDDFGGAYFKVRVIDLLPDSGEATTSQGAKSSEASASTSGEEVTKDREPIETNSFENEIPKGREASTATLEPFDEIDSTTTFTTTPEEFKAYDLSSDTRVNDLVSDKTRFYNPDAEFVEEKEPMIKPISLNRDTYINDLAKRYGKPINPDAEIFDPSKNSLEEFDDSTEILQPSQPDSTYDNLETFDESDNTVDLDNRRFQEIRRLDQTSSNPSSDLSGDIYVNELAAMTGRPVEEMAEVIDVEGRRIEQPKYEYSRFK